MPSKIRWSVGQNYYIFSYNKFPTEKCVVFLNSNLKRIQLIREYSSWTVKKKVKRDYLKSINKVTFPQR